MASKNDVDVLVVGAGPTGLTLAGELLRHGLTVRVVDKADAPTTLSKAIAVHARTLEIFDDLGIADEALSRGVVLRGATMSAGADRIASIDFDELDTRFPYVLSISQAESEAVLQALLVKRGGAVERSTEVVDFTTEPGADAITAVLRGARGDEQVRAAFIVGCDGAHSIVRKKVGATFEGHSYEDVFVLADVRIAWDAPTDRIATYFAEDGIAACFPMKDDRWRVIITADADVAGGGTPTLAGVRAVTERRAARSMPMSDVAWIASFKIHCRQVEHYRYGRALLAGDAAHVHSPAGGQGMNTGIQDAHNLAWKLALTIRGQAKPALLDSYEAERHAVGRALLRATDAATKIGTLRGFVATAARNNAARFFTSFDTMRRRIAREISELDVGYEKSPIVGEVTSSLIGARIGNAAAAESPTVGSRLDFRAGPHPGARALDGNVTFEGKEMRLAQVIDSHAFTLLLFDGRSRTDAGYATLASIARATRDEYGELVRPLLVTPRRDRPSDLPVELAVVIDHAGELEARYGATTECLYLVRPDLYVGFRSQPADEAALLAHLETILTSA